MRIIDGKKLALEIRAGLKEKISKLGNAPGLGVILVGNDPASHLYVRLKEKACLEAGIKFEKKLFPESATEEEINLTIQQFNNRDDINGILVQLPLPPQLNENRIITAIAPQKDVDGFHSKNLEALSRYSLISRKVSGMPASSRQKKRALIIPGVALGIMKLIESTNVSLAGKKAALLVNSEIFAAPLKYLLEQNKVKVDIKLNPKSSTLNSYDIIIIALGRPNFLKADMVKDGAVIIDVGTTKIRGKLCGDADFESFKNRDVFITPVPGGVGPMTVAMLLQNVYNLAKNS